MSDLLTQALMPFQFAFMQKAFIITLLAALPMALLSCYLVLKGWALMGDAVSHSVLPGVVLAYVAGIPLIIGAFIAGLFCALATGYLKENSRIKEDTVMGVVFSGMFGLGIVLYVNFQPGVHLDHILFGDMLGLSWRDVAESGLIALVCSALVILWRRDFLALVFDPQHAQAIGLPVRALHYGMLSLLTLTIVAALKSIGIILSIAMLVAPGAIGFLIARRFSTLLLTAIGVALASSFLGIYASFFLDSAPAPTIVLVMTLIFIGAFIVQLRRDRTLSQSR